MDFEKLKISRPGIIGVERWNSLIEKLQSATVCSVVGGGVKRTIAGTVIWVRKGGDGAEDVARQPFELAVTVDPESETSPAPPKIRVYPSTLAGGSSTDIGFTEGDDPAYLLTPSEGVLQGGITIDGTTGEVTSRWLEIVSELGTDDDTTFYVEIGTVAAGETEGSWIVSNSRYGPIGITICRNWYASASPYFGVTLG